MAIPTVVNVGAVAANAAAITPGMPVGVLTNDILLLFLETAAQAITVAGGTETWAQVVDSPQTVDEVLTANDTRLTIFWARASQNSPTSPTTSDSGNHQLGRIIAFRGCVASGNPWDVTSGSIEGLPTDTSGSATGNATSVADCLVVVAVATALPDSNSTTNFSAWVNADLANVTEQIDNTSNAGDGGGLGVATGEKATAGAYGATTFTVAAASTKAMMTIALKPFLQVVTDAITSTVTVYGPVRIDQTVTANSIQAGMLHVPRVKGVYQVKHNGVDYGPAFASLEEAIDACRADFLAGGLAEGRVDDGSGWLWKMVP